MPLILNPFSKNSESHRYEKILEDALESDDLLQELLFTHGISSGSLSVDNNYYKLVTDVLSSSPLELVLPAHFLPKDTHASERARVVTYVCFEKGRALRGCESYIYNAPNLHTNPIWMIKDRTQFQLFDFHRGAIKKAKEYASVIEVTAGLRS